MKQTRPRGAWVIVISIVLSLMLTALPVPVWALGWRPAWVALVLIYWCLAVPQRVGVGVGWVLGVVLDIMSGTLIGQHALGLCVVAFVTHKLHQQVRVLPLWQQGVSVFGLVLLYQVLVLWTNGIRGIPVQVWWYWAAPLTSMLLWPWVFILLRDLRRKYQVA